MLGAPVALLVDAVLLLVSAAILRGANVVEQRQPAPPGRFWADLQEGLRFVRGQPLLVTLASCVGIWQMCHQAAIVVLILFATRTLGMSEHAVGLSYVALGVGTVTASALGHRISRRIGPGPCLVLGFACTAAGWLLLALAPLGAWGVAVLALMLSLFGVGAVLIFINFISLRQAVTPEPMLGRMTSTMRWLILLPAGPGALIGGWLGEHVGLRASLWFAGVCGTLLVLVAWRLPIIRGVKALPKTVNVSGLAVVDDATT
jgi:predicted MFS family arabinose efflux permease